MQRKDKWPKPTGAPLKLLSVVIPARDEGENVVSTVEHLHLELDLQEVPHEIVVVDDGSTDDTWKKLTNLKDKLKQLAPVQNDGANGFGNAVIKGIDSATGDAVVIMMADESDDCRDVARYWELLNEGWDCVFGSRFMKGGGVIDYPIIKKVLNRVFNWWVKVLFRIPFNDTTNAFKAYRMSTLNGCRPFLAPHFNLTVELPLKAIVRRYSWTTMPITWRNRRHGVAKLKIREMGSRYFFIMAYVWLEKYFSRGDYRKQKQLPEPAEAPPTGDLASENSKG
ncbi:MAG: glycosyltransferase family 2 protein [Limisphaerales bacterium]